MKFESDTVPYYPKFIIYNVYNSMMICINCPVDLYDNKSIKIS